jgi:hypothetical protein
MWNRTKGCVMFLPWEGDVEVRESWILTSYTYVSSFFKNGITNHLKLLKLTLDTRLNEIWICIHFLKRKLISFDKNYVVFAGINCRNPFWFSVRSELNINHYTKQHRNSSPKEDSPPFMMSMHLLETPMPVQLKDLCFFFTS